MRHERSDDKSNDDDVKRNGSYRSRERKRLRINEEDEYDDWSRGRSSDNRH